MTNLENILKSIDITLPTKVHLVKAVVFPVVMYGCESWTIKKAAELMLLNCGVGEDSWESLGQQGDPVNPEYSLEGLMLKLKLQYFGHLMWRTNSLQKTLMLGKIEGRRKRGWQRMRWLDGITEVMDMSLSRFWELMMDRKAWHAAVHGVTKSQTLSDWTEQTSKPIFSPTCFKGGKSSLGNECGAVTNICQLTHSNKEKESPCHL